MRPQSATIEGTGPHDAPLPERLLTVEEAAAILRTHPDCVYRMIRAKQLPAVRLGRAVE